MHVDGPRSRAELGNALGLNRSTIKALVDDLTRDGLVGEVEPGGGGGPGRPSLLVVPHPRALTVLAIDVAVEQLTVALVGMGGALLGRSERALARGQARPGDVLAAVVDAAARLGAGAGEPVGRGPGAGGAEAGMRGAGGPVAAGVSVPGVVRDSDGMVHEAPNLRWADEPFGDQLAAALGIPVRLGNDADLGALAEHTRGCAREVTDLVYLSCDVGVGGGVVLGDTPLRGWASSGGEVGHMAVRPDGRSCYCGGRGCWETEVGEDALAGELGLPAGYSRSQVERALRAAGPAALPEYGRWLAVGLVNLVNLLAPELVVLGGLFAGLPDALVEQIRTHVRRHSLVARATGSLLLRPAGLGQQASLIGAAELAFGPALASA